MRFSWRFLVGAMILALGCAESSVKPSAAPAKEPSVSSVQPAEVRAAGSLPRKLTEEDPSTDGWSTEAFHADAARKLKELGSSLLKGVDVAPFFAANAQCATLQPGTFAQQVTTPWVKVRRAGFGDLNDRSIHGQHHIAKAFRETYGWLAGANGRVEFKVAKIEAMVDHVESVAWVTLVGDRDKSLVEQHAIWRVDWNLAANGQPQVIRELRVESLTENVSERQAPLFQDVTESVLGMNESYTQQLLVGLNDWLRRTPFRMPHSFFGATGLALGDVNGDGWDDVYLCQDEFLPNRLFLRRPDGSLEDVSKAWQVDWIESSRSALFLDLDNDGDQDLVVGLLGGLLIAENQQQESYRVCTVLPTHESVMSLAAADYDQDGLVDIYVCVYDPDELLEDKDGQLATNAGPFVYYDSNNAAPNSLFRNESRHGVLEFRDVTNDVGMGKHNRRWSYAASWHDYDADGDSDLYVANDFGRNVLYQNRLAEDGAPVFRDVAAQLGVEDSASGMSVSWGDIDQDGRTDLYVGNMWSSAGQRIVPQQQFKPDMAQETRDLFLRFARGNSLFQNLGDRFQDVSEASHVTNGRWAWSAPMVDVDNDGWLDLLVANGYITGARPGDL